MKYYKYTYKSYWIYIITIITFMTFILMPTTITLSIPNIYVELCVMLFIFIIHEFLHGVGFKLCGKAKSSNIVYGIKLEKGILYCACKEEITKFAILGSLAMPLIFLTLIPIIIGTLFSYNPLILIAIINLFGASFDILIIVDLLRLPHDIKYKDLDDSLSFILISKQKLDKYRYIGLKITKIATYDKNIIVAKNYKKFTITKPSIIILLSIITLLIISFML